MIRKRLGEILLEAQKIRPEDLQKALQEQRKTGEKLGKVLVRLGLISEREIIEVLSSQLGTSIVDLEKTEIPPEVIRLVPEELANEHMVIPCGRHLNVLKLATSDPLDIAAIDEIARVTKMEIEPLLATEVQIRRALEKYYRARTLVEETLEEIKGRVEEEQEREEEVGPVSETLEEEPVIRLVNSLISQAIEDNASDVHIEPYEKSMRIRMRIDGRLRDISSPPRNLFPSIVSRIKIMAGMDIAKTRVPQDGRFDVKQDGRDVSIRVSTYPSIYGEKVVLRFLDKSQSMYGIDKIGLLEEDLEKIKKVLKKPYGFILATGPTGSGKTTTLYGILNFLNTGEKNIITIEDPVEYTIENITQAQVNVRAGFTFDQGLRAILRQDPDIIMVGEIRDRETAEIAIHAALTGHIVLSTFHTNDAAGALTRLMEMGIEPFLVASSVSCVIAQRLLRRLCPDCKESYKPPREALRDLFSGEEVTLYRGKGCLACKGEGYRGRTGVFEVLVLDEKIRELVMMKSSAEVIKKVAKEHGMRDMREDAITKALLGITSLEEALTVTQIE